jgi:hypothetical protein
MEEDDPKKAFSTLISIAIAVKVCIAAFYLRVCSRLMISFSFFIMNEFVKAVSIRKLTQGIEVVNCY